MGVIEQVARFALRRMHVLTVEAPGDPLLRLQVEAAITREGWVIALSPADADVLLVCGVPTEELETAVDRLWDQMVAPRARVAIGSVTELPQAIIDARRALLDDDAQRTDAHARVAGESMPEAAAMTDMPAGTDPEDQPSNQPRHDPMPHGDMTLPSATGGPESTPMDDASPDGDHETTDRGHGSMDMSGRHHMDMDMDMDMSGPAGIPLAQGEGDRDGLEMDALHLTLGPILPAWPAGLVLRCTLHGDTIASAEAAVLPAAVARSTLSPDERGALMIDRAAQVMQLAGWEPMGIALRRVRDEVLSPRFDRRWAATRLQRLARRIRRSRTLRWSLRGVRPSSAAGAAAEPDAHELLLAVLDNAVAAVSGYPERASMSLAADTGPELASAIVGQDLATARLTIASVTPWSSAGRTPEASAVEGTDE